jgi:acid phosphatase type 7
VFVKLRQLVLSGLVIAIALGAGLIAVDLMQPTPSQADRSGAPTAGPLASDDAGSASQRPTPAARPSPTADGETAILLGAGDIADCERSEDELTADLVEGIAGTVFTVGDNAYPDGSRHDFQACYGPSWGRPEIKDRTRPAPGDEDYDTDGASAYYDYFGPAAGDPRSGYYAYDAGSWRVYMLNSNCASVGGCGEGSAQEAWLRADLAAEPRACVLAIWHHPYFSSGPSGGGYSTVRNFWRVLTTARAELVLSGHDHVYERFAPQNAEGVADPNGLRQFVVGTGGADPDRFHTIGPNSEIRERSVFGILVLRLAPGSYEWEFITVAGREFSDSGSAECH